MQTQVIVSKEQIYENLLKRKKSHLARMIVELMDALSQTRVVEHRDEAVGEGAEETPKILSTED